MSLFGSVYDENGAPTTLQDLADTAFAALEGAPETEVPAAEPAPAQSFAALSVPSPEPPPEPEAAPAPAGPVVVLSDDLLPSRPPARASFSLPSLPTAGRGGAGTDPSVLLKVAVVVLMAVVGYVGFNTLFA